MVGAVDLLNNGYLPLSVAPKLLVSPLPTRGASSSVNDALLLRAAEGRNSASAWAARYSADWAWARALRKAAS